MLPSRFLDMDDARPDRACSFCTEDGFYVSIDVDFDHEPHASYPGSNLWHVQIENSQVMDGQEEPGEFPLYDCEIHAAPHWSLPLTPRICDLLLSRKQRSRVPLFQIARIRSAWADRIDVCGSYIRETRDSFSNARVCVYRDGILIFEDEIFGVPTGDEEVIPRFVEEAVYNARDLEGDL